MIKQQLLDAQIQSMKAKDVQKLQTIRYIVAQIKNQEIDLHRELSDEEAITTIRKELKKMQDAIESFEKAGRKDLITEYKSQADILRSYLPVELSDEALKQEIQQFLDANKELNTTNPNALIGLCVKTLKEKADSSRIVKMLKSMQHV